MELRQLVALSSCGSCIAQLTQGDGIQQEQLHGKICRAAFGLKVSPVPGWCWMLSASPGAWGVGNPEQRSYELFTVTSPAVVRLF